MAHVRARRSIERSRRRGRPLQAVTVLLTVLIVVAGIQASTGLPARAAAPALPITSFRDIVVDDANGHLFLSQGVGSTEIVVVDFTGTSVGTISASEAVGIDLSPDGSTLYAALQGTDEIGMYDTTTLNPTGAPIDSGGALNGELEIAGGSVWFGFEGGTCPETNGSYLGSMPLGGGPVTAHAGGSFPVGGPLLAATPGSDVLITFHPSCAGNVLTSWSASTDPPTVVAGQKLLSTFAWAIEVSEGGGTVFISDSSTIDSYRTSDLVKLGSYDPWPARAMALATTSAKGGWLASGGGLFLTPGHSVSLFDIGGGSKPEGQYVSGDHPICVDGLAFTGDATTLFAIECAETAFLLQSIDRPARFDARVTISMKNPVNANELVKVTARLPASDTNAVLRIERTPLDGNTTVLVEGEVTTSGNLTATVRLKRQTTFVVRFEGDDGYLPDSDRITVRVRAVVVAEMVQPYARSGGYALYHDDARYRVKVSPPKGGKPVYVVLRGLVNGQWRELIGKRFRLNSSSVLKLVIVGFPVGRYRLQTTYAGDRYNIQGVSALDYFRITG